MWVCTRKYFFPQKSGCQNTMFDPQVNFWGSFDPPGPTVPAPLRYYSLNFVIDRFFMKLFKTN